MKLWAKLIREQKTVRDAVIECELPASEADWQEQIGAVCALLEESRPVLLNKHYGDLKRFSRTIFLPEDFMESVNYDKMELVLFSDKKKKKQ